MIDTDVHHITEVCHRSLCNVLFMREIRVVGQSTGLMLVVTSISTCLPVDGVALGVECNLKECLEDGGFCFFLPLMKLKADLLFRSLSDQTSSEELGFFLKG